MKVSEHYDEDGYRVFVFEDGVEIPIPLYYVENYCWEDVVERVEEIHNEITE